MALGAPSQVEIDTAVETFVGGFSFVRSYTHPYVPERVGNLWILRDAPVSRSGKPVKQLRKTEVITHSLPPQEILRQIKEIGLGWHFLCYISPRGIPLDPIRDAFKGRGYKKIATEWMFIHDLNEIPTFESDPAVRRITEMSEVEAIKAVKRRWPMRLEDLSIEDSPQRLYAVIEREQAYGWVSSIPIGKRTWVSDLFVRREMRGKAYGRALMSRMLRDDVHFGVNQSVLMASAAGARLYPHVGYREIGTLQVFCPVEG